jgi:hypothetical protein
MGLVRIGSNAQEFIAAIEDLLESGAARKQWLETVDRFLATMSWDETWARMSQLIDETLTTKTRAALVARAGQKPHGVAA